MFGYSKLKIGVVAFTIFLGILFSVPTFLSPTTLKSLPKSVQSWFKPITLGLDLQGGSYLLMEVDTQDLLKERLITLSDLSRSDLRKAKIRFSGLNVVDGQMTVRILNAGDLMSAKEVIRKIEPSLLTIESEENLLKVSYTEKAIEEMQRKAVEQSVEIVRRRIDELGTKEPQIQQQGLNRIVIQLPGVQDPSEIKALLGKTAKMTFHLVDEETSVQAAQMGKLSPDSMLVSGDETGYIVLKRRVVVSGSQLDGAKGSYDENGAPAVSFSFKAAGAKEFANVTRENVGRRLAIVLDGKVLSAPTINTPITGGQGMITGNFTMQAANDLALMLRAGALPAPLVVAEERVVGPGLGEDSIKAGTGACLIGLAFIFVFMLIVYGPFGIIADITLLVNGILLLALLSVLNATLTLPGVAGIALTLAMAVDANILIMERMKEEIHKGLKNPQEVIKRGFEGSFSAIFDGQLTTLFAALFLFMLGSGSVRGFGITLGLGLATTMYAAIVVNKVIFMVWYMIKKTKTINI